MGHRDKLTIMTGREKGRGRNKKGMKLIRLGVNKKLFEVGSWSWAGMSILSRLCVRGVLSSPTTIVNLN